MFPNVAVASPYPFHMFSQAAELHELGRLDLLYTAYPHRYIDRIPRSKVKNRVRFAALRRAATRISPQFDAVLSRAVINDFDLWLCRTWKECGTLIGLSSFATQALAKASDLGALAVCDRGSTHISHQKAVLEAESERWGWPSPHFDPWIVDRELQDYETCGLVLVPSQTVFDSFVRAGVSSTKMKKVPYGVDLRDFTPAENRGTKDSGAVVSVGQVGLRKGHHYLLQGYSQVRRPGTSLHFVGPCDEQTRSLLGAVGPDISFHGPVARNVVAQHLRRASVFALCSLEEGLAQAVLQAMACGLPVVVTAETGAEEYVQEGVEGFIVPARNPDAIAHAIDRLLADPDLAHAMGEAGRKRVQRFNGWSDYGRAIVAAVDGQQP